MDASGEFESIASEEDISIATDRSETYDPNAADFEDEQGETKLRDRGGNSGTRPPLKSALRSPTVPSSNAVVQEADQSDDGYGEYGDFVDDFETESVSSKGSPRPQLPSSRQQQQHQLQQPPPLQHRHHQTQHQSQRLSRGNDDGEGLDSLPAGSRLLPSLDVQSLQAEVLLDEIGREVVRLRGQQRVLLQERRQEARDKKARADQRRADYAKELERLGQAATAAESSAREARELAKEAERRVAAIEKSRTALADTNRTYELELSRLQSQLSGATTEAETARRQLLELRTAHETAHQQWLTEKAALGVEVKKSEMLLSVVQRSIEASESRAAQDRATLPEHQKRIYEEMTARLTELEIGVREKERALNAEEARRMANLEQLKREAQDQSARFRLQAESDIGAERAELAKQKASFEASRAHWDATRSHESAANEALKTELARKERELDEARATLQRERAELDASQRLLEPNIRAAERDRSDARTIKAQADRVLYSAEEHASSILAAERGLVRREQTIAAAEKGLDAARVKLTADRRALMAEGAKQRASQQALDTERFRLHQCSMELSAQLGVVKRGIGQLARADRFSLRDREASTRVLDEEGVGAGGEVALFASDEDESVSSFDVKVEGEEGMNSRGRAARSSRHPVALDPSLIHTAISLQDVNRTLKTVSAATAAQDPSLEALLGPRSFVREDPALAEPLPVSYASRERYDFASYRSEASAERKEEAPTSFDSLRSDSGRARVSDDVAVASVRSSVAVTQEAAATMGHFAAKYGVFHVK